MPISSRPYRRAKYSPSHEYPRMKDRVEQDIAVRALAAALAQELQVPGQHLPITRAGLGQVALEERPVEQEEDQDDASEHRDAQEESSPGDERLEHDAHGRTESHPPGHCPKSQPRGRPPLAEWEQVAYERQRDGHDAARPEPG